VVGRAPKSEDMMRREGVDAPSGGGAGPGDYIADGAYDWMPDAATPLPRMGWRASSSGDRRRRGSSRMRASAASARRTMSSSAAAEGAIVVVGGGGGASRTTARAIIAG